MHRLLARRRSVESPLLAFIVPDEMTGRELADGVGLAFARSRDALAEEARQARYRACQEKNRRHRAYLAGRADALSEAVARTDAAMADLFAG
ncbi:hypothetical protein [Actinomadura opuntiae]|uniref:hypothetical protein n=1 Tax=Actinomadura sp. OS1-43 TaxID=604315 RepID=UPI00255AEAC6|nr:hypothetical protein [Actinomadura sp. OS1-43]MDL4816931.1 hypothetical protein [Actinomadura sp. OS1-43]